MCLFTVDTSALGNFRAAITTEHGCDNTGVEPTFSERALQNKVDELDVNTEDNVSGGINDDIGEGNWVWLYTVKAVQDWFGCALW